MADGPHHQRGLIQSEGPPRDVRLLLVVGGAIITLALLKPWSLASESAGPQLPAASPGAATATGAVSSAPLASAPPTGLDVGECPGGQDHLSLVGFGDSRLGAPVRINPSITDGPFDARLEFAVLRQEPVQALGLCDQPSNPPEVVRAWRLAAASAPPDPVNLIEVKPWHGQENGRWLPRLYQPITRKWSRSWPAGRYVLEVANADRLTTGQVLWIGVEVDDPAAPLP
jgi:hypothetical protein